MLIKFTFIFMLHLVFKPVIKVINGDNTIDNDIENAISYFIKVTNKVIIKVIILCQ